MNHPVVAGGKEFRCYSVI